MPRPRKKTPKPQSWTVEMQGSVLEHALLESLRPMHTDFRDLSQRVNSLEQEMQQFTHSLNQLHPSLAAILGDFLAQLQTLLKGEQSSSAKETLQQQLHQLIAALSDWNNQIKTEIHSQQRLITSIEHLEEKLGGVALEQ